MSLMVITTTLVPLFDLPYLFLFIIVELKNFQAYVEYTPVLLRLSHGLNFFIYFFYNQIFRQNARYIFEKVSSKEHKIDKSNMNIFSIFS